MIVPEAPSGPRLTLVGTGIRAGLHTTAEAQFHIRNADRVFHLLNGPVAEAWIRQLNPAAEPLDPGASAPARERERAMVDRVLAALRSGANVCAAFYGHPAVFVGPAHTLVRRAREEGFEAAITPGVSFEDCLWVDLECDPARRGCRSFDATDFLLYRRRLDPRTALVLWQVGAIGYGITAADAENGLELLRETLARAYPAEHEVVLFEAPRLPVDTAAIVRLPLRELPRATTSLYSTCYVPPLPAGAPDAETARRLGVALEES